MMSKPLILKKHEESSVLRELSKEEIGLVSGGNPPGPGCGSCCWTTIVCVEQSDGSMKCDEATDCETSESAGFGGF